MPGGGTIRIAARSADSSTGQPVNPEPQSDQSRNRRIDGSSFVEIEVLDTGPGVPAEDRERIFEPFFTTKEGGTGLGLAIARQIAQDHGGSLTCENSRGGGATLHLILPVRDGGRAS
jgi:signal transduction histidine kinase